MNINKLILSVGLTMLLTPLSAQSTVGKDFWVTFLPNFELVEYMHRANRLELIVTGKRTCSGSVTNPNTHWSTTFEVQPGLSTIVPIPIEGNYQDVPAGFESCTYEGITDCILNQGLHVVTTDSVSLYASNSIYYNGLGLSSDSFEVACVLSTQSLGDTYIIQTYPSIQFNEIDYSEFSIIAVENNTVIDINLTEQSAYGHYANRPFSVTLQAGQCYQILSANGYVMDRDLSGTNIKARNGKRIAVFAGNNSAAIQINPNGIYSVHHLYEQLLPVSSWGKQFIVTKSLESPEGVVRITASNNFCEIKRNGVPVDTIHARQTYEYEITSNTLADFIETSEPAQVYLYFSQSIQLTGNDIYEAPAMVVISPLEQRIKDINFSTFSSPIESFHQDHFVNIVAETDGVSSMELDGNNISSQFHPVPYDNGYSYARIQIQHGVHTLSNTAGGLNEGGFIAHVYGLGDSGCYACSTGCRAIRQTAQIMVNQHYSTGFANGFWFCEDDTVNFSLYTNYEVSRADWRFGDDSTETGTEVSHHYSQVGNYNVSCDVYKLSAQGQDSLMGTLTTKIHIQQPTEQDMYDSDCDFHIWNGETYTESGMYTYHGHSLGGCDSIVNMHLTLHPTVTIPYDTTFCDQYEWHDSIYSQTGVYTHLEGQTNYGCDSLAELHLTIEHASQISIDGPTQVYAASNLISGNYIYRVSDSLNIDPNTLEWQCSNPEWIIEPSDNGYSCRLIVTTTNPGTLEAITHNTTGCNTSCSIEINATFYDVDDNGTLKIPLFPNPAQTTVILVAQRIQRVRIYNHMGQNLMDISTNGPNRLDIDISALKQGIYFVEIDTAYGKTTQPLSILR